MQTMKILYFYRSPLPSPSANAIQVVNTCAGMSRAGAGVVLGVESLATDSTTECLTFFGIVDPAGPGGGSLDIRAFGRHWSWPFLHLRTRSLIGGAGAGSVLFVREVRPYVPGLIRRARLAGLKVIFEAHSVSSRLVEEKARKEEETRGREAARLRARAQERGRLERAILGKVDGLICTQRASLPLLQPMLPGAAPAIVIGNAAPKRPAPLRNGPHIRRDIDLLYCGSLKRWKGVDGLLAALPHLPGRGLTIVGLSLPSDVARLALAASALGVADRVTILPEVRPADVWSLYARSRVGVIPLPGRDWVEAREYTSPLKLFEMLAAGLPVVASRLPSIEEYVNDDRDALLVPPDDPAALAAACGRLLNDATLHARISAAGRARAAAFTWDARGEKIVAFAARVAGGASQPWETPAP